MARNTRVKQGAAAEGFWDRPVLMNLAADLLFVLAAALLAWAAFAALRQLPVLPLRELVVVSEPARVGRAQIEHAARGVLGGNLLTVDLDEARGAFEKLPWVRRAALRRGWPDTLELAIEEHVAVARWTRGEADGQEARLVNSHGEVFVAVPDAKLPSFAGPEGTAPQVLARYREFEQGLGAIGRRPVAVALSPRAAWQVRLDDGVLLDLGRDQPKSPLAERLRRFTEHYAAAREQARLPIAAVDMRYPHGFALRVGAAGAT